ncbi:hypothetical protein [Minwuia sp.]|uniref:hypothetical protein n=1 Tax=Minwuia sp. TaxID=2493630 RepID=UPI003A929CA7
MFRKAALAAAIVSLGITSVPATAQKYEAWKDPDNRFEEYPEHTQKLLDELDSLIRQGKRDKAASPKFLSDLEEALKRHRKAERKQDRREARRDEREDSRDSAVPNISDNFADGNFTANPRWNLVQGDWFIARGNRLFSFVAFEKDKPLTESEKLGQLFGALLGANTRSSEQSVSEPSTIFLPGKITNAFDLSAKLMSDDRAGGVLEVGVYQGSDGRNGYRIQFTDGKAKLIRVGSSVTLIGQTNFRFPASANNQPGTYDLRWVRSPSGRIQAFVGRDRLFDVTDNGFRDPFDGFRMVNAGGRHGLDSINIDMSDG